MQLEFIHIDPAGEETNRRLILIFAGWGSDPRLYEDIYVEGWDTAVVWDYRNPVLETYRLLPYSTIYVYAWSMGVWGASTVAHILNPDCSFAINGTGTPRHDLTGIPADIYDGTLDTLDERNLKKFRRRMAGDKETAARLDSLLPPPDIESLKDELASIRDAGEADAMRWSRAYISEDDRIFPAAAQRRYFSENNPTEIHFMKGGHYPDLCGIVKSTVFNPGKVGKRFGEALATYDGQAHAQRDIAVHLSRLIAALTPRRGGKVLEIGSGSGLFTRIYAPILQPAEATYIDLYATPEYGIALQENYHICDAEKWLCESSVCNSFDAVVSASTIQWFSSPKNFFRNAARVLKDGGILAVSSFTKGNLNELDALRPSPIIYRDAKELEEIAKEYFDEVEIEEKDFRVNFSTAREALMHLKQTGVGGSHSTGKGAAELMRSLPRESDGTVTLTYRAVFIAGLKK